MKDGKWISFINKGKLKIEEVYQEGENVSLVGNWKINNSYTIEYFKDGSAIVTSENGKISKSSYSIKNGYVQFGYNRFDIIELKINSYKVKEKSSWNGGKLYTGVRI